jgi:hypothetical protein
MAYEKIKKNFESARIQEDKLASQRFVREYKHDKIEFYEFEPAVVLDIILDREHPVFQEQYTDALDFPPDINGGIPLVEQYDYSWIGRIKFRFYYSQKGQRKETLYWALPLENTGIIEYPLLNEVVSVVKYIDTYYYTRKVNLKSLTNASVDFAIERRAGLVEENFDEFSGQPDSPMSGPRSKMNALGGPNYEGVLGSYFKFNPKIRTLKKYEGDLSLESRFGSSIRFGAYDENRSIDNGLGEYSENGGNPYVLFRNRQATVSTYKYGPGFTAKGYVTESINQDGSSIHMTSGKTISEFITTCNKVLFQSSIKEEQPNFSPTGSTEFKYPTLDGDQVVINSDRLIFSSRAKETFHFSKKRLAMVTDDEFTIDSHKQIVLTTNDKTTINSPKIYLGAFEDADEPVLLGRTSVFWIYQLCNWMIAQTDLLISQAEEWHAVHIHEKDSHKDDQVAPKADWSNKMKEYATSLRQMKQDLIDLRDKLPTLMSTRVFTVGGGGAPGYDGGELKTK